MDLINSSTDNIKIEKIELKKISNDAFKIINNINYPLVLSSKEQLTLEIEFLPTIEKSYQDSLKITISQPCKEIIPICLTGNGIDKIPVIFVLPDTTAKIGDENFAIPVFAHLETDTVINKNVNLTYEVIFNSRYFLPENVSSGKIISSNLNQNLRIIRIESDVSRLEKKPLIIAYIKGKVLVGGLQKGILKFGEINFSDSTLYPEIQEGGLIIEGVCQHSLNDFELIAGTSINLNSTVINNDLEFIIRSNENGIFHFRIFDINGKEVINSIWNRSSESINIEEKTFKFDWSEHPSGYYLLSVVTPKRSIGKAFLKVE